MPRVRIISVLPLVNTRTNIGRIASSTGIYGKFLGGTRPINGVKVRGGRLPKGSGRI